MSRKVLIQIRRGLEKDIGILAIGELGYSEDTKKLHIGTASGNVLLVAAQTAGDMLKTIYDINNDGKVDMAEVADNVPWAGITGKPSTFTPSTHTHTKSQITDFPSSLPANGGNSDTVDGKHASDFLLKASRLSSNTDFNTIIGEGFYYNPSNAEVATMLNTPIQQALTLIVLPNAGCTQIVLNYLNNDERIYVRNMYMNNWGTWKQIARTSDIPTKLSQLTNDADYLKKGVTWNGLKGV